MNAAEQLILQMEMNEYLKVAVVRIINDMKENFPDIPNIKVTINVWISPTTNKKI